MEKKKSDTKDQGEKENGTEETSQQGGSHLITKEKEKGKVAGMGESSRVMEEREEQAKQAGEETSHVGHLNIVLE